MIQWERVIRARHEREKRRREGDRTFVRAWPLPPDVVLARLCRKRLQDSFSSHLNRILFHSDRRMEVRLVRWTLLP